MMVRFEGKIWRRLQLEKQKFATSLTVNKTTPLSAGRHLEAPLRLADVALRYVARSETGKTSMYPRSTSSSLTRKLLVVL